TAIIMITFTEPAAGQPGRVDYAGIGVLAGAAAVLMLLLFWGGQAIPWRSPAAAGLAAVFAALVVLFIRVERRTPQPFLPFSLFADRVMAVGSAGGFLLGASMFSAVVYIPLFVQGVIGTSATTAGIVLMPFMLCWTFGSIAGGRLALRWGYRPVTIAGMVMLAAGFARLARLEPQALVQDVFASMAVLGVGMGLTATIFMISMQNAVPRPMRGIATSITLFSRNIGNFDHVIAEAADRAYAPLLGALERHPRIRLALHYSGPLLDWLRRHRPDLLERIRALAARGQVEMLTGGYYEPILAIFPDADKRGQIEKLTRDVAVEFGVPAEGLWLAERVWEPHLARPLGEAGVRYTIVDDTRFHAVGLTEPQLLGHYPHEDAGVPLAIFPSLKRLRYLIPWGAVEEVLAYLRTLAESDVRAEGREDMLDLALMGDDGEKFGLWPGTYEHCWTRG